VISRNSDPAVRRLRDVRDGRDASLLFVEGVRLAEEILASGLRPTEYFFSPSLRKSDDLLTRLERTGAPGRLLSEKAMAFASGVETPPGLILTAPRPPSQWEAAVRAAEVPLVIVLDGVQSPANAGAVLRVAEAAGATAVLQSSGGTDLLGPKSLRASAGSAFRIPCGSGRTGAQWAEGLAAAGLALAAADGKDGTPYDDFDWDRPLALFLGGESGFSFSPPADVAKVRIPMRPPVESLNVAVAAGILLFQAARGRIPLVNTAERT
jgi:RNA methyltransferase, TrmH family